MLLEQRSLYISYHDLNSDQGIPQMISVSLQTEAKGIISTSKHVLLRLNCWVKALTVLITSNTTPFKAKSV